MLCARDHSAVRELIQLESKARGAAGAGRAPPEAPAAAVRNFHFLRDLPQINALNPSPPRQFMADLHRANLTQFARSHCPDKFLASAARAAHAPPADPPDDRRGRTI